VKALPDDKKAQIKKWDREKIRANKSEIEKMKVPKDAKFFDYKQKHGFVFCMLSSLTFLVTFKYNKMFYSHFYSFSMFKASWSDEPQYRKTHMWFTIVHMMFIDLGLIVIGVAGIISLQPFQNQLWITFCETVILSLIDIILSSYELLKLKDYLSFTGKVKQSTRQKVSSGIDEDEISKKRILPGFYDAAEYDEDSRAQMMHGLLAKVQANKNRFLNNKLDELLNMFGDRRCKSMVDLGTGWDKEDDPRKIVTIPMSPTLLMDKYNKDFHFTRDDAYGDLNDNCYAEAAYRDPGVEQAV
jgi:hypothetical protein